MRLEPFQGLGEPSVPLGLDHPDHFVRAGGRTVPDRLDGPVEVPEDAPHLVLQGGQGALPEGLRRLMHAILECGLRRAVRGFEAVWRSRKRAWDDGLLRKRPGNLPSLGGVLRDGDDVERLALLVRGERRAEREEVQGPLASRDDTDLLNRVRGNPAGGQDGTLPVRRDPLYAAGVPAATFRGEAKELLERIAARCQEFRIELPDTIRVEREAHLLGEIETQA